MEISLPNFPHLSEENSGNHNESSDNMEKEVFSKFEGVEDIFATHPTLELEKDEKISLELSENVLEEEEVEKAGKKSKKRYWTEEEHKRLLELMRVFPEEEFPSRRYRKIAKALGDRNEFQVMKRIESYYKRLYLAGLPVPVSSERLAMLLKDMKSAKKKEVASQTSVHLFDEATEGSMSKVEVIKPGFYKKPAVRMEEDSLKEIPNFSEMGMNEKKVDKKVNHGTRCACCGVSTIIGDCFSCEDCKRELGEGVDICEDCFRSEERRSFFSHKKEHRFEKSEMPSMKTLDIELQKNQKAYLFN